MKNERGSTTLVGLFILGITAIMAATLWAMGDYEGKRIEGNLQEDKLLSVAEWGTEYEYSQICNDPDRAEQLLRSPGKIRESGSSGEYKGIKYAVYTGESHGHIVIWTVVEQGDTKAQRGYWVDYDPVTGECTLRGRF